MAPVLPTQLLRVTLDSGRVESEAVPERWLREYVGGKGLAARYLYEELEAGVDPLGPENVLLLVRGPLTGQLPGDPRYAAVTKSPLTGVFLDSYGGGTFPRALAAALPEHVGILIEGAAGETVVLELTDGSGTIRKAPELRGVDTEATDDAFPDDAVACIGPAGENAVRYATIATDGGDHHAGRGGAGAVMGSKGLKAVVVSAGERPGENVDGPIEARSNDALADLRSEFGSQFEAAGEGRWHDASGTLETADFADEVGALPTRGWQERSFEGTDGIGIDEVRSASIGRERPDDDVPGDFRVQFRRRDVGEHAKADEQNLADEQLQAAEQNLADEQLQADEKHRVTEESVVANYTETVIRGGTPIALGSGLGIDEFDAVATLGERCDRLGLDVISAGNAIAWTMLASDRGLVDRDLSFGDADAALTLLDEIAGRSTPLGAALADGVERAADQFGGRELVPTVKAMEAPTYDPRGSPAMALAYATSDRGACHRRAQPVLREVFDDAWSEVQTARVVTAEQDRRSVLWSLIVDDVTSPGFEDLGEAWLEAIGVDIDREGLRTIGERIWTLTRLFNVREGISRTDDTLPAAFTVPVPAGSRPKQAVDQAAFDRTIASYYAVREWDEEGRPTHDLLERLSLADVVDTQTPVGAEPRKLPNADT